MAGDICPHFSHKAGSAEDIAGQVRFLEYRFKPWLEAQPAAAIVGIWGNHDFVGEQQLNMVPELPWTLLNDTATTVANLSLYGTPFTPTFYNWAFMEDEPKLAERFARIPANVDILISHGPPKWACDRMDNGERVGSTALFNQLTTMLNPPQHVVCGHIHCGRGHATVFNPAAGVEIWNVAGVDERYIPHEQMWTEILIDDNN